MDTANRFDRDSYYLRRAADRVHSAMGNLQDALGFIAQTKGGKRAVYMSGAIAHVLAYLKTAVKLASQTDAEFERDLRQAQASRSKKPPAPGKRSTNGQNTDVAREGTSRDLPAVSEKP